MGAPSRGGSSKSSARSRSTLPVALYPRWGGAGLPYGHRHTVLEADLLASGGLTSKQVAEFFRVFCDSASSFNESIQKHELKARGSRPATR